MSIFADWDSAALLNALNHTMRQRFVQGVNTPDLDREFKAISAELQRRTACDIEAGIRELSNNKERFYTCEAWAVENPNALRKMNALGVIQSALTPKLKPARLQSDGLPVRVISSYAIA